MSNDDRYLLDTNVISESRKRAPDPRVLRWLNSIDQSGLFISVLTLGELRKGVRARHRSDPDTAARIGAWVDDLESRFASRILPIDAVIASRWGELSAERARPVIDTLIAATAQIHDLVLVTHNTSDMRGIAVRILDPWTWTASS